MAYKITVLVLIIFIIVVVGISIFDSNRICVEEYVIDSKKVKSDKRFIFLSDLHSKSFGRNNEKLIEAIKSIDCDAILIGGDMITAYPNKNTKEIADLIGKLKELKPVYYAYGNHEYRMRLDSRNYGNMHERYMNELSEYGISLLDNENETFEDVCIYGLSIESEYYRRFKTLPMSKDYIEGLIGKLDDEKFNIVLAHNPDYFDAYCEYGADLYLSGHVHGGVVRLPLLGGVVSPRVIFFPPYDSGTYKKDNSVMIVSRGLGTHTIKLRVNNTPEISLIHIKSN